MGRTKKPETKTSIDPRLDGSWREEINGWMRVPIHGSARDRGLQHGYLLADEVRAALRTIRYLIYLDTGLEFDWFAANAEAMFTDPLASNHGGRLKDGSGVEILEELEGIVAGVNANRKPRDRKISLPELMGWNGYPELICSWFPAVMSGQISPKVPVPSGHHVGAAPSFQPHFFAHHCSAFVAAGDHTADGGVVIAQTTWQRFANGDAYNVIVDIEPRDGHRILMQSVPGYVNSSTDFSQTSAGLAIAETSINVSGFDPTGLPEFFRSRRATQYANSISSWRDLFKEGNNGGYVNTWFLADSRRGEIAALELTLKRDVLQPVLKSGYYTGYNIPLSVEVRNLDCPGSSGYDNILKSGSRRVRFDALMRRYKGRIDAQIAQAILADHFDEYTRLECASGRTVCGHFDNDDGRHGGGHGPYYPWGSLDGKVTTSASILDRKFWARWGRACGTPLVVDEFLASHPQYEEFRGYMKDRPSYPWTEFHTGRKSAAGGRIS